MINSRLKFDFKTHKFTVPVKLLKTEQDVKKYERSPSFKIYKFFITDLSEHVVGKHYRENTENPASNQNFNENDIPIEKSDEISNKTLKSLDAMLDRAFEIVDETPCITGGEAVHRFGNRAYQTFFDKFSEENRRFLIDIFRNVADKAYGIEAPTSSSNTQDAPSSTKVQNCEDSSSSSPSPSLDSQVEAATNELIVYLHDSFGNRTRIDYGSGHEAAFLAFIQCLFATTAIKNSSVYKAEVVNIIFRKYLKLMRKVQTTYRLEPAGSKGNFGLDDFQFCCYIFGGAQLRDNIDRLLPDDYPSAERCERFKNKYMFFEAVDFIHNVKSGPFSEHSNQLWNISGVQSWEKIHTGMIKKYSVEVLGKLPIMQHFYFGSLFPPPF